MQNKSLANKPGKRSLPVAAIRDTVEGIHVVCAKGKWQVKRIAARGNCPAYHRQENAVVRAKEMGDRLGVSVYIHDPEKGVRHIKAHAPSRAKANTPVHTLAKK
jgi:hypothetical protein